jgi:hypothetical protein
MSGGVTLSATTRRALHDQLIVPRPAAGMTRFALEYGMGDLSHEALMRNIELCGSRVVPPVGEIVGER